MGSATLALGTAITPQDRAADLPTAVISLQAWHRNPITGWPTLLRHPIAQTTRRGTGLLTRCPSPTAFALSLGPTDPTPSTVASETSGISAGAFFTRLTLLVPAFALLRAPASLTGSPSLRAERSPTLVPGTSRSFGAGLRPAYLRRRAARPVSYYALFEGWLPLSQPPGCRSGPTSFLPLSPDLRTLAGGLGCFPLDDGG